MPSVVFRDRVGGSEEIAAKPGQPLASILRNAGIPFNAVICRVNGDVVAEDSTVIGADDQVAIQQVRHYDLGVLRAPRRRLYAAPHPVYTKSVVFDDAGELETRSEQYDANSMVAYVEQTFVESVVGEKLFATHKPVVVGLSGGRDSVAFLKLLARTAGRIEPFPIVAITVTGLPDWDESATMRAAAAVCVDLGIDQVFVGPDRIEDVFHLRRPFVEVMNALVGSERRSSAMVIVHHVLRRMLEIEAAERRIETIALGLNADDLVASLVTWVTTGFQMGGIPERRVGPFRYTFPLFRITKKELTLYLELLEPVLADQGAPGRFTTGPDERSLAYAVTDVLLQAWPGVDYYLFEAFRLMQTYMRPAEVEQCRVCGASFVVQPLPALPSICDICDLFSRAEMSTAR